MIGARNTSFKIWNCLVTCSLALIIYVCSFNVVQAQPPQFQEAFETGNTISSVLQNSSDITLETHRTSTMTPAEGKSCEEFIFASKNFAERAIISTPVPNARMVDDMTVSFKVHSTQASCTLGLEFVFPKTIDPRTNQPFRGFIQGTPQPAREDWQTLEIKVTPEIWQERLRLWQAQILPQVLVTRGELLSAVHVHVDSSRGWNVIRLDDLRVSPYIKSQEDGQLPQEKLNARNQAIKFRMGRLTLNNIPFFPRVIPYHGEELEKLKEAGFNMIWADTADVPKLTEECERLNLWLTTSPPVLFDQSGEVIDPSLAVHAALTQEYRQVLFWTLGTRIEDNDRASFSKLAAHIRHADPWRRPLCLDVKSGEEIYSRDVEILGVTRHILHTTSNLQDYRQHLLTRTSLAEPGAFLITHIQTEASPAIKSLCQTLGVSTPIVEPEQIRQQVYAALSTGMRGLSFWKSEPITEQGENAQEKYLALKQVNLELQLLEPFLSTGTVIDHVNFEVGEQFATGSTAQSATGTNGKSSFSLVSATKPTQPTAEASKYQATVIQSDKGHLVLAGWYDPEAQFVPNILSAPEARFVIRGIPETAMAWEITPTALIPLEMQRVEGGMEIRLRKSNLFNRFDQNAAIIICSDREIENQVQARIQQLRASFSEVSILLAESKLLRVRKVISQLQGQGQGLSNDSFMLRLADDFLVQAKKKHQEQDYHMCALLSARTMQLLRSLQFKHWSNAKLRVNQPNATIHTISFQTLPDFWELISHIGKLTEIENQNVLPSGEFENIQDMRTLGWKRMIQARDDLQIFMELNAKHQGKTGDYALRLTVIPADPKILPVIIREPPLTLYSPTVQVEAGDIVHVSGWVAVDEALSRTTQGFRIYDNVTGVAGALRFGDKTDWIPFEIIREIPQHGDYQLTFEMAGLGDLRMDHLKVNVIKASHGELVDVPQAEPKKAESNSSTMDLFERLSNLRLGKNPKKPAPEQGVEPAKP